MSERKVLNFYYGKNFDPSVRLKRKVKDQVKVRIMTPFSFQCMTCGGFTYKATKANALKEVTKEKYLDIPILRFYFSCQYCSATLTFKTDPKNFDYTCEFGATRNYDTAKTRREVEQALAQQKAEEERGDAMKQLENRMLESKREMEQQAALEELQERSELAQGIDLQVYLQAQKDVEAKRNAELQRQADEEDEEELAKFRMARVNQMLKASLTSDAKAWKESDSDPYEEYDPLQEAFDTEDSTHGKRTGTSQTNDLTCDIELDDQDDDVTGPGSRSRNRSRSRSSSREDGDVDYSNRITPRDNDDRSAKNGGALGDHQNVRTIGDKTNSDLLGTKRMRPSIDDVSGNTGSNDSNTKRVEHLPGVHPSGATPATTSSTSHFGAISAAVATTTKPLTVSVQVKVKPKAAVDSNPALTQPTPPTAAPIKPTPSLSLTSSLAQYGSDSDSD